MGQVGDVGDVNIAVPGSGRMQLRLKPYRIWLCSIPLFVLVLETFHFPIRSRSLSTYSSDVGLPAPLESASEEISEIEDLIEATLFLSHGSTVSGKYVTVI